MVVALMSVVVVGLLTVTVVAATMIAVVSIAIGYRGDGGGNNNSGGNMKSNDGSGGTRMVMLISLRFKRELFQKFCRILNLGFSSI